MINGDKSMLITRRLIIKTYEDTDEERMVELLTDETIRETYMLPEFDTRSQAVTYFKKLRQVSFSADHYEYGIYRNNELIGFVNDVSIEKDSIEIGFVIHPDSQNNGYATEMLFAVIKDLFSRGFSTVTACVFENNKASRRVLEKCGMKRAKEETNIHYQGRQRHCIYYSVSSG